MPIYIVGQELQMSIAIGMKILRAFAYEGFIYYIVWIKHASIKGKDNVPVYGVLRNDGTPGEVPLEAQQKADELVQKENLLNNLE